MAISRNGLIIIVLLVTVSIVEIGVLVEISVPDFLVRPYLQKLEHTGQSELNSSERAFQ